MTAHLQTGSHATVIRVTRRDMIGGAAVLCLGLEVGTAAAQAPPGPPLPTAAASPPGREQLAAFLEIATDGAVTITTPDLEFGQGVFTSLPMILADELGADWERVVVRQSWADERFINPMKGIQATGRSMSVRGQYDLLRRLGATARVLLCTAAATGWRVDVADCTTRAGEVVHRPSGRRRGFGALARAAARLPVPASVALRPDAELTLLGRDQRRKDVPAKVLGRAEFGVDVRLPGMLVATIRAAPVFGATLLAVDEAPARALPGVVAVVRLPDAVAVVARDFWQASTALDALDPRFTLTGREATGSDAIAAELRAALGRDGLVAASRGAPPATSPAGGRRVTMDYEVPFLAHATMEPMTCTALVDAAGCRLWAPSQGPIRLRDDVAAALGIPKERVSVQRTFAGGGFGRRWQTDFGVQAALIARAVPGRPVKLVWSRTEDMQHDFYRPAFAMRCVADTDAAGALAALDVTLAGPSIVEWGKPGRLQGKVDTLAVSTFADSPYAVPGYRVRWVSVPGHVPVGVWRSVGQSHNGFFMECAIDEAAAAAGRDPLDFRLALLDGHPRQQAVLRAAAARAGWGRRLPAGEGMGLALVEDQGSYVAQAARVRVAEGRLRVLEVCCAIDCGRALQPEVVRMQMEGGIVFALSALLHGEIHIENGAVRERNFHDYRMATLAETPVIHVDIVDSGAALGGVGEPGVPPLAPAVVNALFAATGRRIRSLPLARHGLA